MFSKGTYQRYLFELRSDQERTEALYRELTRSVSDSALKEAGAALEHQLQEDRHKLRQICALMEEGSSE